MRRIWVARGAGLVGLSAASAIVAHAGLAGLQNARLLAIALAGALVAAVVLCVAGLAVLGTRRCTASLTVSTVGVTRRVAPMPPVSASVVMAVMLVGQTAAHLALLLSGVQMVGGQAGTLAVHVVMAGVAGVLWLAVDRLVVHASRVLDETIAALLAWLRSAVDRPPAWRRALPPAGESIGLCGLPRGPPILTA